MTSTIVLIVVVMLFLFSVNVLYKETKNHELRLHVSLPSTTLIFSIEVMCSAFLFAAQRRTYNDIIRRFVTCCHAGTCGATIMTCSDVMTGQFFTSPVAAAERRLPLVVEFSVSWGVYKRLSSYYKDSCCLTSRNRNELMRHAVVEVFENFDHQAFFNVYLRVSAWASGM